MSLLYVDSSVVLSFLLSEKRATEAATLWAEHKARCSSILLEAEVYVGLRRQRQRLGTAVDDGWLQTRLEVFDALLKEVSLVVINPSIMAIIRAEPKLSDCRSLDAIHLATALRVAAYADDRFRLATFDERMLQTAMRLNLDCIPAP